MTTGNRSLDPSNQAGIEVTVRPQGYRAAEARGAGWPVAGEADLLLSGVGFDRSGGPLAFRTPSGIAADGGRLYLADREHHRVLVWNRLPEGDAPPDRVLGQPDFDAADSGSGPGGMNGPVAVSAGRGRLAVADTWNRRVLLWNAPPTRTGQPADRVLEGIDGSWGVWTDGRALFVSETGAGRVLAWDRLPAAGAQEPDFTLTAGGQMRSPRGIVSDGRFLMVGDTEGRSSRGPRGNFVWRQLVAAQQPHDFFFNDPRDPAAGPLAGAVTPDGRLVLLGRTLYVWKSLPEGENDAPTLAVEGFPYRAGDGSGIAVAGGRVYLSLAASNRVLGYRSVPERPDRLPDFALDGTGLQADLRAERGLLQEALPATDGRRLFAISGRDRKLCVWRRIPDESGALPDVTFTLPFVPRDLAVSGESLAVVGEGRLLLWKRLPLNGELPDTALAERIGSVWLEELSGVALDGRRLYLADARANRISVWDGLPEAGSAPREVLRVDRPGRLAADGRFLAIAPADGDRVRLYAVGEGGLRPVEPGPPRMNAPEGVALGDGRLVVAETGAQRVAGWARVEDAAAGKAPDLLLGTGGPDPGKPWIARDRFFYPGGVALGGGFLWVGEVRHSGRLLRFPGR